jgi:hypothetical protein
MTIYNGIIPKKGEGAFSLTDEHPNGAVRRAFLSRVREITEIDVTVRD